MTFFLLLLIRERDRAREMKSGSIRIGLKQKYYRKWAKLLGLGRGGYRGAFGHTAWVWPLLSSLLGSSTASTLFNFYPPLPSKRSQQNFLCAWGSGSTLLKAEHSFKGSLEKVHILP